MENILLQYFIDYLTKHFFFFSSLETLKKHYFLQILFVQNNGYCELVWMKTKI